MGPVKIHWTRTCSVERPKREDDKVDMIFTVIVAPHAGWLCLLLTDAPQRHPGPIGHRSLQEGNWLDVGNQNDFHPGLIFGPSSIVLLRRSLNSLVFIIRPQHQVLMKLCMWICASCNLLMITLSRFIRMMFSCSPRLYSWHRVDGPTTRGKWRGGQRERVVGKSFTSFEYIGFASDPVWYVSSRSMDNCGHNKMLLYAV